MSNEPPCRDPSAPVADPSPDPALASDALPRGPVPGTAKGPPAPMRRPGEALFAGFFLLLGLVMLWSAYGISGLGQLSAPGTVPMATTLVMALTAGVVLVSTLRRAPDRHESLRRDILPGLILLMVGLLALYAALLVPLGFLPTSLLFLIAAIKLLSGRGWGFAILVALLSLVVIYLIFRIVFTVLMPPGIVPEGQILQWVRDLLSGGA